jgi:hypothetical protein
MLPQETNLNLAKTTDKLSVEKQRLDALLVSPLVAIDPRKPTSLMTCWHGMM